MMEFEIRQLGMELDRLIQCVYDGEVVLPSDSGKPIAQVQPTPPDRTTPRPLGLARGLGKIHESFFDPLPREVEDAFQGIGE